jgi:hypothetical protein
MSFQNIICDFVGANSIRPGKRFAEQPMALGLVIVKTKTELDFISPKGGLQIISCFTTNRINICFRQETHPYANAQTSYYETLFHRLTF